MLYAIEKNVPLPKQRAYNRSAPENTRRFFIDSLEIGDSFFVPDISKLKSIKSQNCKLKPKQFRTHIE